MLDVLNGERDRLLRSVETGRLEALDALDPDVRAAIAGRIRPLPAVAGRLRREVGLTFANVWPGIRLVTTWTGGSCGIALETLRKKLPPRTAVMELGYQATKSAGPSPSKRGIVGVAAPRRLLLRVRGAGALGRRDPSRADARGTPGRPGYIIVTTASGLYRYFMNDLVEVSGVFRQTLLISFVQKGKGETNSTGREAGPGAGHRRRPARAGRSRRQSAILRAHRRRAASLVFIGDRV